MAAKDATKIAKFSGVGTIYFSIKVGLGRFKCSFLFKISAFTFTSNSPGCLIEEFYFDITSKI